MNKPLLIAAVVLAGGVIAADAYAAPRRAAKDNTEKRTERKKVMQREPAFDRGGWQPTVVKTYDWWDSENNWSTDYSETTYKYDEKGRLVEEVDVWYKTVYTYNADGQVSEELRYTKNEENEYVLQGKEVYEYDTVVKDFEILRESYYRAEDGEDLVFSWGDKSVVTRDENGNVTKVEKYYRGNSEAEYVMDEYFTVEYDADSVASLMTLYYEDEDDDTKWNIETQLKDIVWQNTNGQILDMDDDIDTDDYFIGANRVKSALAVKADGMPDGTVINAEYPDELGSFKFTIKYGETLIHEQYLTYTDENGSCKEGHTSYDVEEEDGKWEIDKDAYTYAQEETFDKFGLTLNRESSWVSEGEDAYSDKSYEKGEVTYDEETGLPTEYITMYKNGDDTDFRNYSKKVYSDYVDVSGVQLVEAADADEAPVYYDMRGLRVNGDNLPAGLYIERRGTTARKILVK